MPSLACVEVQMIAKWVQSSNSLHTPGTKFTDSADLIGEGGVQSCGFAYKGHTTTARHLYSDGMTEFINRCFTQLTREPTDANS